VSVAAAAALAVRLLQAYAFDAWPFALLHLVVVVYLARSVLRLMRETSDLRGWAPNGLIANGPAAILSSFVRDSRHLGERGFVVPITDYSDRLDSEVENLVGEIGDRTNMLLLVGIGGTLFGIFEFASRVRNLTGDRLTQIGSILAESMAKAFPVGLVGLVLMLVFQLALATPISRLYKAASEATRRALEYRGEVSRTIAESIADSIGAAMRPVSTLGVTVSEHLQPVVTTLGERLEQSLSLVKVQFGEIDQSTQRFIKATGSLHESTDALLKTSARLEELLRTVPEVLAGTARVQDLHETMSRELAVAFRRNIDDAAAVAGSLRRVGEAAKDLPAELIRRTSEAVRPAFEAISIDLVARSRDEMEQIQQSVHGAADEWRRLAASSEAMITKPLESALAGVAASVERALGVTAGLTRSLAEVEKDLISLPDRFADRTADAIKPAFARVAEESSATWRDLVQIVASGVQRDYADYIASSRQEVEGLSAEMRAMSDEIRRLAEGAQASMTEPLKTAIETARAEVSGAVAEVDAFVRERYPAIRSDMEAFGQEMKSVVESLRALERLDIEKPAVTPPPAGGGEIEKMLQAILDELKSQASPKTVTRKKGNETIWQIMLRHVGIRRG
jgi:uncharacterized coiled-coil protein SlyX